MSGVKPPVGRLHFDRFENLMSMIAGSKKFVIFGPDQGSNLYAASPLKSGSLKFQQKEWLNASAQAQTGNSEYFVRNSIEIDTPDNIYHTYSPVDIRKPNYTLYPRFRHAKRLICEVKKGEILYVPTDWWHEVTSFMDDEGKSIGVNVFFEPMYKKPGYRTLENSFLLNRYYSHLYELNIATVCAKSQVCFKGKVKSKKKKVKKTR